MRNFCCHLTDDSRRTFWRGAYNLLVTHVYITYDAGGTATRLTKKLVERGESEALEFHPA
jgi:hypothetical protein